MIYALILFFIFNDGTVKSQAVTSMSMSICNDTKPLIIRAYKKETKDLKSLRGYCIEFDGDGNE